MRVEEGEGTGGRKEGKMGRVKEGKMGRGERGEDEEGWRRR